MIQPGDDIYQEMTFSKMCLKIFQPALYSAYKKRTSINPLYANDGDYPSTDRDGNELVNIGLLTIADFFSRSRDMIVQTNIMQKYCIGDLVILVLDPTNERDIIVIATNGKLLGRLPNKESNFIDQVKRRLKENYAVFAQIFDYATLHNGRLRCEIRIVYYETPFDKRK